MAGKEKYKIGTWNDAPQRKGSRQFQGESSKKNDVAVTKFFVSNLPGGCASSDLVTALKGFGVIHNTYIARKVDRLGKHFGFVSFVNVSDPLALEKDMKDVWIGSYKLFIVLARFVDGERMNWKGDKRWTPRKTDRVPVDVGNKEFEMDPLVDGQKVGKGLEEGRSFRDKLLNVESVSIKKPLQFVVNSEHNGGLSWIGYGAVGRVYDFKKLSKLRIWLDLIGQTRVGIKYIGGLWVLLVFESELCLEGFMGVKEVWKVCFDNLEIWEGQLIPNERIAWLKVFGLPLCLYDKEIVDGIGGLFGSVIQSADFNNMENDLSYVMMGVLRDSGPRVNELVKVLWKEKEFSVMVEEELGDWTPDCLEDFSQEEVEVGCEEEDKLEEMDVCLNNDFGNNHEMVNQENSENKEEEPVVEVSSEPNDVQVSAVKSSKRKSYRKKVRAQKSPSPVGLERPKKRARDGEDIFDIDRFIFAVNSEEARKLHGNVDHSNKEDFLTPDLNGLGDEVQQADSSCNVAMEVKETVTLGKDLGVEDYDKYADSVEKVIQDEGFQLVHQ
ncbi:nucleotide-binding alpha-beta plait domain-containing protein [Artemisia annua]|uniref:Nucleotide-binding alpha-beta plait domain-containing protein n=1 Tax=Artemisia annua TaxID=35608 RepID=A0A2U1KR63_ARTAN|nr:nucleotide-binding alpha-beta plait domain-containing protein [Artemisia annua]